MLHKPHLLTVLVPGWKDVLILINHFLQLLTLSLSGVVSWVTSSKLPLPVEGLTPHSAWGVNGAHSTHFLSIIIISMLSLSDAYMRFVEWCWYTCCNQQNFLAPDFGAARWTCNTSPYSASISCGAESSLLHLAHQATSCICAKYGSGGTNPSFRGSLTVTHTALDSFVTNPSPHPQFQWFRFNSKPACSLSAADALSYFGRDPLFSHLKSRLSQHSFTVLIASDTRFLQLFHETV